MPPFAWIWDSKGRIPELPDVLAQRLKALEGQTGGKHWTVTSQFELVPDEAAAVATSLETEQAAREARETGAPEGPSGKALRQQSRARSLGRLEKGQSERQAKQGSWKKQRLAQRREGRGQGLQGKSRGRQGEGQEQREVKTGRMREDRSSPGSNFGSSMGVVATPPILVEGQESEAVPPSPGGVGLDVSAGEFGAKPPFWFHFKRISCGRGEVWDVPRVSSRSYTF